MAVVIAQQAAVLAFADTPRVSFAAARVTHALPLLLPSRGAKGADPSTTMGPDAATA